VVKTANLPTNFVVEINQIVLIKLPQVKKVTYFMIGEEVGRLKYKKDRK